MRISNIKVQFQINAGPQIKAGGVYLKFDHMDLTCDQALATNVREYESHAKLRPDGRLMWVRRLFGAWRLFGARRLIEKIRFISF